MSLAGSEGAANDAAVRIRERLDALPADPGQDARTALQQELYELQHRVPGTREHAAHRAQLVRLVDEAARSLESAATARKRAKQALDGAEDAYADASGAADEADGALTGFDRDYGSAE